ncbi:Hypothetical predicted protein, partial [Paramuricea clavata]
MANILITFVAVATAVILLVYANRLRRLRRVPDFPDNPRSYYRSVCNVSCISETDGHTEKFVEYTQEYQKELGQRTC